LKGVEPTTQCTRGGGDILSYPPISFTPMLVDLFSQYNQMFGHENNCVYFLPPLIMVKMSSLNKQLAKHQFSRPMSNISTCFDREKANNNERLQLVDERSRAILH
jgi:hypothetical protein